MEKTNLTVPLAIVAAGIAVAIAVYVVNVEKAKAPDTPEDASEKAVNIPPVTDADHIKGNPEADLVVVEYSDLECPFCKNFQGTMNRIMDTYGKDGRVAWVYRHFPIDSIHPKARKEAEAAECAEELGGEKAFWEYIDRIFAVTPSNNNLDPAVLPDIAEEMNLDRSAFEACLSSGKYAGKIEEQYQGGLKAGVRGTPQSFIITRSDGAIYPVEGAQPFEVMRTVIEAGLPVQ